MTRRTVRRFTKREDDVILKSLYDNPYNRKRALKGAAKIIGRTYQACYNRWYGFLKHRPEYKEKMNEITGELFKKTQKTPVKTATVTKNSNIPQPAVNGKYTFTVHDGVAEVTDKGTTIKGNFTVSFGV